jgi:hypothetical protein
MKRSSRAQEQLSRDDVIEPTAEEIEIIRRLRRLPEYRRQLVQGVIEQFSLDDEIWKKMRNPLRAAIDRALSGSNPFYRCFDTDMTTVDPYLLGGTGALPTC